MSDENKPWTLDAAVTYLKRYDWITIRVVLDELARLQGENIDLKTQLERERASAVNVIKGVGERLADEISKTLDREREAWAETKRVQAELDKALNALQEERTAHGRTEKLRAECFASAMHYRAEADRPVQVMVKVAPQCGRCGSPTCTGCGTYR